MWMARFSTTSGSGASSGSIVFGFDGVCIIVRARAEDMGHHGASMHRLKRAIALNDLIILQQACEFCSG
jgi:hypothetical protein